MEERKLGTTSLRISRLGLGTAGFAALERVENLLARYPLSAEVMWVQEEPKNMGPWRFIFDQIQPLLNDSRRVLRYAGRPESASPSAGSLKRHQQEQAELIEEAFAPGPIVRKTRRLVKKKK